MAERESLVFPVAFELDDLCHRFNEQLGCDVISLDIKTNDQVKHVVGYSGWARGYLRGGKCLRLLRLSGQVLFSVELTEGSLQLESRAGLKFKFFIKVFH